MSEDNAIQFPSTEWTGVQRAGQSNTLGRAALGELLTRYLAPLRAHLVLQKRIAAEKADDLLQSFIADRILERDLLTAADRERGRFRTFLLMTLDRFVSNRLRDENRQCRSPENSVPLDDAAGAFDPAPGPDRAFEIAWARQVLLQAAEQMRDACFDSGRSDVWQVFDSRVLAPTLQGADPASYEELAAQFSLASAHAASNLMITGKRMFARSLKGVVGEYIEDASQIDDEIAELRIILAGAN